MERKKSLMNKNDKKRMSELVTCICDTRSDDAIAELFQMVYKDIYEIARIRMDDVSEIEDMVFDTFEKAIRKIEQLEKPGSFKSWLCVILQNNINDYYRKKYDVVRTKGDDDGENKYQLHTSLFETTETGQSQAEMIENFYIEYDPRLRYQKEIRDNDIYRMLSRLPNKQFEAIVCVYFFKMTNEEAARELGVKLSTFKSRKYAALEKLKNYITSEQKDRDDYILERHLFSSVCERGIPYNIFTDSEQITLSEWFDRRVQEIAAPNEQRIKIMLKKIQILYKKEQKAE